MTPAKRLVLDAPGADEKGRGQAALKLVAAADPDEHAAPRSTSTRTSTCPVPPRSTAAA